MRQVGGALVVSVVVWVQHGRDCAVVMLPHQQSGRTFYAQLGRTLRLQPALARPGGRVDPWPGALEEDAMPGMTADESVKYTSPSFLFRFPVLKLCNKDSILSNIGIDTSAFKLDPENAVFGTHWNCAKNARFYRMGKLSTFKFFATLKVHYDAGQMWAGKLNVWFRLAPHCRFKQNHCVQSHSLLVY